MSDYADKMPRQADACEAIASDIYWSSKDFDLLTGPEVRALLAEAAREGYSLGYGAAQDAYRVNA